MGEIEQSFRDCVFPLARWISASRGTFMCGVVRRGDSVAKFWLDPVALQEAGGYGRPELDAIEAIVNDHRDELLEGWFDFYGHI